MPLLWDLLLGDVVWCYFGLFLGRVAEEVCEREGRRRRGWVVRVCLGLLFSSVVINFACSFVGNCTSSFSIPNSHTTAIINKTKPTNDRMIYTPSPFPLKH